MIDWSDLQFLLALSNSGSLAAAAEALGVNRTTVSRRIAALEKQLDARLVERVGRDLMLTQAGREVVSAAHGIEGEVASLERRVAGRDAKLAGRIRLTTMSGLAQLLAPALSDFCGEHPDIELEVSVTNALEDLESLEADIGLRFTPTPPEALVGRRVASPRTAIYASPATAATILTRADPVPWYRLVAAPLPAYTQPPIDFDHRVVLTSNSVDVVKRAVAEGDGFAILPCYTAESDPSLVRVGALHEEPLPDVWLLYHPRLRGIERVRAFVEHLTAAMAAAQDLFEGRVGG